jgi:hypothetical protein
MRASKYPLESWWCSLPFWYSTLSRISDRTAPEFNLLTAAHIQDRISVVIRFFMFGGNAVGLSIAIHYMDSKSYALLLILQTTIESSLRWHFVMITFLSKSFEPNCLCGRFLFFKCWELLAQKLEWFTVWSSHSDVVSGITHSCSIH